MRSLLGIWLMVLLAVALAGCVESSEEPVVDLGEYSVDELFQARESNELRFDEGFQGNSVTVAGVVRDVGKTFWGQRILRVSSGSAFELSNVACYVGKDGHSALLQLSEGEAVVVRGVVGSTVLMNITLDDCVVVNSPVVGSVGTGLTREVESGVVPGLPATLSY